MIISRGSMSECSSSSNMAANGLSKTVCASSKATPCFSQFAVAFEPDKHHLARVSNPRLFETRFVSPQPFLSYLGEMEWHLVRKAERYRKHPKPAVVGRQLPLFPDDSPP